MSVRPGGGACVTNDRPGDMTGVPGTRSGGVADRKRRIEGDNVQLVGAERRCLAMPTNTHATSKPMLTFDLDAIDRASLAPEQCLTDTVINSIV